MEIRYILTCVLVYVAMVTAWDPIWLQPEQVHLSATGKSASYAILQISLNMDLFFQIFQVLAMQTSKNCEKCAYILRKIPENGVPFSAKMTLWYG